MGRTGAPVAMEKVAPHTFLATLLVIAGSRRGDGAPARQGAATSDGSLATPGPPQRPRGARCQQGQRSSTLTLLFMRLFHRRARASWERNIPILTKRQRAICIGLAVTGFATAAWSNNGLTVAVSVSSVAVSLTLGLVAIYLNDNVQDKEGLRRSIDQTIMVVCATGIVLAIAVVYQGATRHTSSGSVYSRGFIASTESSELIDRETRGKLISNEYPSDVASLVRFSLKLDNDTGKDIQVAGFDLRIAGKFLPLIFYSPSECYQKQHTIPDRSSRYYAFKSVLQRPESGGMTAQDLQLLAQQNVPLSLIIRTVDGTSIEVSTARDRDPTLAQDSEEFAADLAQTKALCPDATS